MKKITVINNFKLLFVDQSGCLSYKRGGLYFHKSLKEKPVFLGSIPMAKIKLLGSRFRLMERLLRLEPRCAIRLNDREYLVSFYGSVYKVDSLNGEIIQEHDYRNGMSNVMNFCPIEGIEGFCNGLAYGEYWSNPTKEEVSIYSRNKGIWEKAYTFEKGKIRHIHALVADPFRKGILILTGDENEESGIWIARDNFTRIEPLIVGSQSCRACVAFPVMEGIIYATDAPGIQNHITLARLDEDGWVEEKLAEIPGPCIYAAKLPEDIVLATTVEPDIRLKGLKYRLTYRLAQGITDRYTHVITGNHKKGFTEIVKLKKDALPMWLFQFGNVQFPTGFWEEGIVMVPIGTKKYDGKTILYKP